MTMPPHIEWLRLNEYDLKFNRKNRKHELVSSFDLDLPVFKSLDDVEKFYAEVYWPTLPK
jgi:hypothetical protein